VASARSIPRQRNVHRRGRGFIAKRDSVADVKGEERREYKPSGGGKAVGAAEPKKGKQSVG